MRFSKPLALAFLLLPALMPAQQTFEVSFNNGVNTELLDVSCLSGDAVVAAGTSYDNVSGFDVPFLSAFQPDGQLLWQRPFPNTTNSFFSFDRVRSTLDNGLIVAGTRFGPVTNSLFAPLLMKTNVLGQQQWAKVYTGTQSIYSIGNIRPTRDGGFICCGEAHGTPSTDIRFFLLKVDSLGNQLWGKLYRHDAIGKLDLTDVYEDENSDYYTTGHLNDTAVVMKVSHSGTFRWLEHVLLPGNVNSAGRRLAASHTPGRFTCAIDRGTGSLLLEMDTLGVISWTELYTNFYADDLTRAPGSGYTLSGSTATFYAGALVHVDNNGQLLWSRKFDPGLGARLVSVDTLYGGNGYAACGRHLTSTTQYGYVIRTDITGKLYCNEQALNTNASPQTPSTDTLVMTSVSYFTPVAVPLPSQEYIQQDSVICSGIAGIAPSVEPQALQVWPVPAAQELNLVLPVYATWELTLIDATGKTVLRETISGSHTTLGLKELPAGLYLLCAGDGNRRFTKTIVHR